jgi:hypothetical protein
MTDPHLARRLLEHLRRMPDATPWCVEDWRPGKKKGGRSRLPFGKIGWSGLEVHSRLFAAILLDLVRDFLTFIEAIQTGAFDRADVDEDVLLPLSG